MARIRNTKMLGQRVDRTYLKKLFPIPLWRRILTLVFVVMGVGWLGLNALQRNQTPYTAGALTPSHASLGRQCAVCHGPGAGIGKKVSDQACSTCHDGPIHQASETFTPACISCHVEHRGTTSLAGSLDTGCLQCHKDLKTKTGQASVAASISSFASHPEFAAVQAKRDPSGLRFNHQKHVGELSQKCGDCHTPAALAAGTSAHSRISSKAAMSIPTYAGTCAPCHALTVDDKVADAAPHVKPDAVHQFAEEQLKKYIAAHPGDLGKDGAPGAAAAWVAFRLAADDKVLLETTCARCHTLTAAAGFASAVVEPTKVPARWFAKASFDHGAHQQLTCVSCHANAATSTTASDVMLPGINVCQQCHTSGSTSAGDTCATCHLYHDWSKEKPVDGKYTIEHLSRLRLLFDHFFAANPADHRVTL